jgi:hypothetical protein
MKIMYLKKVSTQCLLAILIAFVVSVLVPGTALATIIHKTDWEAAGFESGWGDPQTKAAYSMTRVTSPVRSGSYAARVEVRPGDVLHTGERSELARMLKAGTSTEHVENAQSGTKYLGVSVNIPTDWTPPDPNPDGYTWGILWQLHSHSGSPPISFGVQDQYRLGLSNPVTTGGSPLSEPALNKGKWTDFIFEITFSATNTGAVKIWRRDEGEASFVEVLSRTGIGTLDHSNDHYWKIGFYRSPSNHINIYYLDNFVYATTYNEVEQSFGVSTPNPTQAGSSPNPTQAGVSPATPTTSASCQNVYPSGSTPLSGFGASWNPLTTAKELLVNATSCTSSSINVTVGSSTPNLYTYSKAYSWNGSSWQLHSLVPTAGATQNGDWIIGAGTVAIPRSQQPTYFAGYTCQLTGTTWKCGCKDAACTAPAWQLQSVQ